MVHAAAALLPMILAAQSAVSAAGPDAGARLDAWLQRAGFHGSVLVVKGDDVLLRKGYGGGRIAQGLIRLALGEETPVPHRPASPSHGAVSTSPLGTKGRDAIVRAWFSAFNAPGLDAMHAFRMANGVDRPGSDEADRDRMLERMRRDLGRLELAAVVSRTGETITVRAGGSEGRVATFEFHFTSKDKLEGVGVELGQ